MSACARVCVRACVRARVCAWRACVRARVCVRACVCWQRQSFAKPTNSATMRVWDHRPLRFKMIIARQVGKGGRDTGSKEVSHSTQEAFEVFLQPGSAREVGQTGNVASQSPKGFGGDGRTGFAVVERHRQSEW